MAECVGILGIILIDGKGVAIVAIQAILRGHPDKAPPILQHGKYRILRQALFQGKPLETQRGGRRKRR